MDQLYLKLLYIAFGLGIPVHTCPSALWQNSFQTTLNPVNYLLVFKKLFMQVSSISLHITVYFSRGAITISPDKCLYWSRYVVAMQPTKTFLVTNILSNCKLKQFLLKTCIKHTFCIVLLHMLPGCRTWMAIFKLVPVYNSNHTLYILVNDENVWFC